MKIRNEKILIIGLFLSENNKNRIYRTAADQLAELLRKNGYHLITASSKVGKLLRLLNTIAAIVLKSKQYKISIVPLYGTFFSYWWAYISCKMLKLFKKKIILVVHGGSIPGRMNKNSRRFLRVITKADKVVCPSSYLLNSLADYNLDVVLIENVLNLNDYQFNKKEVFRPRLLWMRTLEDIYNPEMAIRVLAILAKKYPNIKLVMAGRDQGSLKHVKALCHELNVDHLVELPGYIDNDEKNKYAEDLDIYVCTNRIDNAPVSLIEMMAMGLAIVSVNVGGIPDLLQNKQTGLLVNLHDDNAMADCISSIIENPSLGQQLTSNALKYSKQFGEEQVIEKWTQIFKQLNYQQQ